MPTNRLIEKERVATYARALFEASMSDGGPEGVLETCGQADDMIRIIRENTDFENLFMDALYTPEQRAQVVRGVFASMRPELVSTVAIMAERKEVRYLPRVVKLLEDRMADELDIIGVEVDTAIELDDHLRNLIKKKVETEMGKKAVLHERVNEALLGGIIMSTRGERIDASLLTQIGKIRDTLER